VVGICRAGRGIRLLQHYELACRRAADVVHHFLGRPRHLGVGLRLAQEVQQVADVSGAELCGFGVIDDRQMGLGQAGASVAVLVVAPGAEGDDVQTGRAGQSERCCAGQAGAMIR